MKTISGISMGAAMKTTRITGVALTLLVLAVFARGALAEAPREPQPPLPPLSEWHGASEALMAAPGDPWITPAERSGLTDSPSYDETVAWLRGLASASPRLEMLSIGQSPEGRELWLIVASKEGAKTPAQLRANGRPTLFAQAGIHSGEIDGKDAGMMLLRDLREGGKKAALLDGANLLFLPIFSVDGHERASRWSRINQRGPVRQGWRTNARNLNLNRDYAKLDTPEMQALIRALNAWPVQLYLDLHVTDGADYQYDITFGWNLDHAYSPHIADWLDQSLGTALERDLGAMGHVPGPLIFQVDKADPSAGIYKWTASPRFSNGYGDLRHLPSVLVENHSLKPFKRRVLGTYVLLESCMQTLAQEGPGLRSAIAADRALRRDPVPLSWKVPDGERPRFRYKAIRAERVLSEISGDLYPRFTGEKIVLDVPVLKASEVSSSVRRPIAYWVPPAWPEVIERLRIHGLEMETLSEAREIEAEVYRIEDAQLASSAYEGRIQVKSSTPKAARQRMLFPAGSVRIPTDQPLGDLAVLLLEPASRDSFFQWGFFLEIFSRTEYVERYVMEPLARQMLAEDPGLRAEFEARLAADREFRASAAQRLSWFYERTPYYDERYLLYPVARELRGADLAVELPE